jgi:simple sugar transport system permease protein
MRWSRLEELLIPLGAILGGLVLFALFVWSIGQAPLEVLEVIYEGAFASAFSWKNSLLRAAPLILTGLAVALPAQAGLMMIGAEGTLALGALAAAASARWLQFLPPMVLISVCLAIGALAGAAWMALAGLLRARRGLNETITSLLLSYIAIAVFNHLVEGPLRDPSSLNKPSTFPVGDANMIGTIPGIDVHWGLLIGVVAAVLGHFLVTRTTLGFSMRVAGGNVRAARLVGLPVASLLISACAIGGAAAGLAGGIEIFAVQTAANSSVLAGYGYTGILVAFMARQKPLAIVPVAILMGGISAAGSLLQRRLDLPDATTLVLQGLLSVCILSAETLYGRSWSLQFGKERARTTVPPSEPTVAVPINAEESLSARHAAQAPGETRLGAPDTP